MAELGGAAKRIRREGRKKGRGRKKERKEERKRKSPAGGWA